MNTRVQTLDGVRGIAILLVLAGHVAANYQPLNAAWRHWLAVFANPGVGVRLFFVLSGYLITHLLLKELKATGTLSIRNFYRRRVLRIFPAFFVYLLAITVLSVWLPMGVNRDTFIAAATFTWNYQAFWATAPEDVWPLGHLWTLALEQQFYLIWPLVLLFAGRRSALWIAVGLILWCPLARVGSYYLFPTQRGLLGMMFHTGLDPLMAGCAAALLLTSARWRSWVESRGVIVTICALIWLVLLSPMMGQLVRGFSVAFGFTLDAVAASWLVARVHYVPTASVQKILGRAFLPLLGAISYSLYLWQQLFLSPTGWLADANLVFPILAACAAATLSYQFVEQPFLRLKARVASPASALAADISLTTLKQEKGMNRVLSVVKRPLQQPPG